MYSQLQCVLRHFAARWALGKQKRRDKIRANAERELKHSYWFRASNRQLPRYGLISVAEAEVAAIRPSWRSRHTSMTDPVEIATALVIAFMALTAAENFIPRAVHLRVHARALRCLAEDAETARQL